MVLLEKAYFHFKDEFGIDEFEAKHFKRRRKVLLCVCVCVCMRVHCTVYYSSRNRTTKPLKHESKEETVNLVPQKITNHDSG